MLSYLLQMLFQVDISKRIGKHDQNSAMIQTIKRLDDDEQREDHARSDGERISALGKEFKDVEAVDSYLKIKYARISAFVKHEEEMITTQLKRISEAKRKIEQDLKKIKRDPTAQPMRMVYQANLTQLATHETQLTTLLQHIKEFRRSIRKNCVQTIKAAAKIRWWA